MTTKTLDKKTKALKQEVELLRSFIIGQAGKDPEGEYKPDFVRQVLKMVQDEPKYEFKNAKDFLEHLQGK